MFNVSGQRFLRHFDGPKGPLGRGKSLNRCSFEQSVMRVGVTVNFNFSFFSSGSPQTVLSVAETIRLMNNEVFLINTDQKDWWEDVNGLKDKWSVVHVSKINELALDCVIEVYLLKPDVRKNSTVKRHIWLSRKAPLFNDIECCLYPIAEGRCLDGITEIWLYNELCSQDDIQYIELLTRKPVTLVPFAWSASAVETHRIETKAPVWQQVAQMDQAVPWSIHICETNMSSSSSSTIPLLIMREVAKGQTALNKVVKIHNAEAIHKTKFFTENVLAHVFSDIDMSGTFIGRQRIVDWVYDPKSIVIAHSRFYKLRPYHFDCLWAGIPLVHNSEILCRLGESVSKGFYPENELSKGSDAFQRVTQQPLSLEGLIELRSKILEEFSPLSKRIQQGWAAALYVESVESVEKSVESVESVEKSAKSVESVTSVGPLRVGFSCMWDLFNPEYNMFTLMLQAAIPNRKVIGLDYKSGECDILIFGPFGDSWKSTSIPKIHFTGENTEPIIREDVVLNLGFKHTDMNDGKYLRLPLWMLEIDWFHADVDKIGNPKPLPIDRCCKVYPEELNDKKKFCAFVVTNPRQEMRNNAFKWLSTYKHVDSAGRLFNNVGDDIFAGLGGGGGELKKHEFLKGYKFCLAYENDSSPGYTTEKWLHAKAAGTIPIYWGDPKVERDFDMDGCIDAREARTPSELISLVKEVDANASEWLKRFSRPALDEVRRDLVRRTLSECAKRIWIASGKASAAEIDAIPRFLGHTEGGERVQKVQKDEKVQKVQKVHTKVSMDSTTFVTAANKRFLPSLYTWLNALAAQKKEVHEIGIIVYLFNDVDQSVEGKFKEEFPFALIRRFPDSSPANFTDLWDPQHFAWKLWILNECMTDGLMAGKPLLYMDAGVLMCRWPRDWLRLAMDSGICLLEDPRQNNRQWCHDTFVKGLSVTQGELDEQQLWAGAVACMAGHPLASLLFSEAWALGQKRDLIVGEKWSGIREGKPFGHRHDQSILSVLSSRMKIPRINMDTLYCDISLRQTFLTKKALYVHRGLYQVHHALATGIDDAWVINLDRREDRMKKFLETNYDIAERVHRLSAFDGKKLRMGKKLARLFMPHDFNWKKPVMGCALSHLALWVQLAGEREGINSYLILEDDARLCADWRERWEKIYKHDSMPADCDVMYLGGILPPNKEGFQTVIEPVNKYVARIKEHQLFGQPVANRYMHFCAYAYVLTRRGAEKILEVLKSKGGYWTSADHMICNIHEHLNIYFTNPLLAGCFQDDDPAYCNSQFNDFSRVDSFDSDLWNNTERFSEDEISVNADDPLDIEGALEEARNGILACVSTPCLSTVPVLKRCSRFVSFVPMDMSKWYEYSWMKQMFSFMPSLEIVHLRERPTDCPIVVVQRPHVEAAASVLKGWSDAGIEFYVLHMSDEFGKDPIEFYGLPGCKGVIRNYARSGLPTNVVVIPLGFHWAIPNGEPLLHTPRPPFRELMWSFVGTGWLGRKEKLEPLTQIGENKVVFMDDWNSPSMLGREECLSILLNSWCVPCPSGHNGETFRFYEALEAGAVPIVVRENNEEFLKFVQGYFQMVVADSWTHAAQIMMALKQQPEVYEKYRTGVLMGWESMKAKAKEAVKKLLS